MQRTDPPASSMVGTASGTLSDADKAAGEAAIIGAFASSLADKALDDAMRGELMVLPSETYLFEAMASGERKADPGAIHAAREGLKAAIGTALADELRALHARASAVALDDPAGRGARKVKTLVLAYAAAADPALARAHLSAKLKPCDRKGLGRAAHCGRDATARPDAGRPS